MSLDLETAQMVENAKAVASVSGERLGLTDMMKHFAALYVATGGKAEKAAELAGYKHPAVESCRLRLHPKVKELITQLALADVQATIPLAIGVLVEIAQKADAPLGERRKAAMELLDRAGVRRSDGPQVAVQINNNGQGGDGPPSAVIGAVWTARQGRLSGIAAPMPDTSGQTIEASSDGEDEPSGDE